MNRRSMKPVFHTVGTAASLIALLAGTAQAQGAPVVPARAPTQAPTQAQPMVSVAPTPASRLQEATGLIERRRLAQAVEILRTLVNTTEPQLRAQARYLLAYALDGMGRPAEALEALEGTLANETPLGKAIGTLRGQLFLQEAELAFWNRQPDRSARMLADYERGTVRPDGPRYQRLKRMLNPSAEFLNQPPLRVGVLLPQRGTLAAAGTDLLRALQLGLPEFTAQGRKIELLLPPAGADLPVAASYLRGQRVEVVLGPLLAADVGEAAAILGATPLLTFSTDAAVLGSNRHSVNFLPGAQAAEAAELALAEGKRRFAALIPQGAYGEAALRGLRQSVEAGGGTLVKTAIFNPQDVNFGPQLRDLGQNFEALLIPAPAALMPLIGAQLAYHDLDKAGVQWLGTAAWHESAVLGSNATMLRGALFAAPRRMPQFTARFTETFGSAPHPLAALGYDAAALLAQLAAAEGDQRGSLKQALMRPEGFYAPGGYLKFRADGQTERGLSRIQIVPASGRNESQFSELRPALQLAPLPLPNPLLPENAPRGGWW